MKFGIFDKFWDNQPNHLPLLNLKIDLSDTETFNLGKSLKLIDGIISENEIHDIYNDTRKLLTELNWRLHLVALITILKLEKSEQQKFIGFLWKRLCLGTWVSPQLLVTLSKIDFNFKEKAQLILKEIGLNEFRGNYLSKQELAERKFNYALTNNKILNSLRYLKDGNFLTEIDDDNGAKIALNWNEQLSELNKLKLIKN
ncbi:hypothetical protein BTO06_15840 [Tenacibaculum sp. SZ-18]|uniref:hypothetical protein n=1 Tax=Tenacibaculum sp. SZ-18 TaxID=754423 RepID=UPI000C2D1BCB|nr:hypothetical protein [Tenacibaculum sp. SZ-18]AUC16530.1 hypothetical protein BTO06_15840 [Tenacibaculum sp. SZ-18]